MWLRAWQVEMHEQTMRDEEGDRLRKERKKKKEKRSQLRK